MGDDSAQPQAIVEEIIPAIPSPKFAGDELVADPVKGDGSEESASGEEDQGFVIRKRSPLEASKKLCSPSKGRVTRVVAAFEAGLTIADEVVEPAWSGDIKDGKEEGGNGINVMSAGLLDEYGSNLLNPPSGLHKRPIEVIEGEVGTPPTPKKQFVEVADVLEKVEEASLEWPQPDK
ncbi:unnamed protein product [Linum trigynum]|uniref:Uncharacterized protein n=1 Tax=Linum trigynum TaxID=586398 RepID=A0AAV2CBN7_9ROSI